MLRNRPLCRTTTPLAFLCALCVIPLVAPSPAPAQSTTEMEAVLFVQNPHLQNGRDGIDLVWIPEPIQRLCLGKTGQQCAAIDYCIRTTTKTVAMCRDLGIPLSLLPSYPSGMRPMRQHTVTFFAIQPSTSPVKSIAMLQDFYRGLPPVSLDRLSMRARVKARIRYTRKADDDDLDVFEILSVAPF